MITNEEITVAGMKCPGCEATIEETIKQMDGVHHVKADYQKANIRIRFDTDKTSLALIREACAAKGYPCESPPSDKKRWIIKTILSVLALTVIVAVILLARNFGHHFRMPVLDSRLGYGMILVIGFLTGLHCVGMCGSFIVGYTAMDAEQDRPPYRSHILYGMGKILSYAMFGALFGYIGSFFRITPFLSGVSISIAGAFLILFGLGMLNIFSPFKALRIGNAGPLGGNATEQRGDSVHGPFFIGFFSGFLIGCGPLQVMYVMAAGIGDALEGAKILALFGFGTLPALLGFGLLTRLLSNNMTRRFLHASGMILIVLGSIMLNKGLTRMLM